MVTFFFTPDYVAAINSNKEFKILTLQPTGHFFTVSVQLELGQREGDYVAENGLYTSSSLHSRVYTYTADAVRNCVHRNVSLEVFNGPFSDAHQRISSGFNAVMFQGLKIMAIKY